MTTFIALWAALVALKSHATIEGGQHISISFTNPAEARTNATWSDGLNLSEEGLGWDGESNRSRRGWIQTVPMALGLSWRPITWFIVHAKIEPAPKERTMASGQMLPGEAGDLYVRYSPDLKHWSSWQNLQRSEAWPAGVVQAPGRYYSATIRIPSREHGEYGRFVAEYSRMDVPWSSDEEAAVRWIVGRDPDFFAKRIPFIGYAQFLFEGEFYGGQRIRLLRAGTMWSVGGASHPPRDQGAETNRFGPWRYEDRSASEAEPVGPVNREQPAGSATNRTPSAAGSGR